MHKVKCIYCLEEFDRDKEPFVQVNAKRYAHAHCAEKCQIEKSQEEKDYEALENYIMQLFGKDYIDARIRKQIKDYHQDYKYSYSGMLKTLIWWYDIKGNSKDAANGGIGIVPFVYEKAMQYYYALYLADIANEKFVNYKTPIKEVHIASPEVKRKEPKLFKFGEDDEN